jgi:hypothetical protein
MKKTTKTMCCGVLGFAAILMPTKAKEQSVAESHHTQPFTLAIQAFTISASLVSVAKGKKPQPRRSIHR